ncbi:hypothetical protein [Maribacter sp. ACAM166]|uniref:hypothetical protein n=1 Tax=Maribacter sp. ACAM166 TaxID=2508996 RepID=UPI0010FE8151|nr:hypothetical protein [Maribacter sp. ACAM166]TLP80348.1 hypothetical protein ES765_07745 [Maribacter sp. ACAM166]
MRTILFLFLVICLGTQSQAQEKLLVTKVQAIVMPLTEKIEQSETNHQSFETAARFFKVKNARVKRALLFKSRSRRILFA